MSTAQSNAVKVIALSAASIALLSACLASRKPRRWTTNTPAIPAKACNRQEGEVEN